MIRKAIGAIIYQKSRYLLIYKTKVNTNDGKENINGEWDFVKGGVEKQESDIKESLLRELYEETGSTDYRIVKQFDEKICFEFPDELKVKIGYKQQETTMFLVEYLGDSSKLTPLDDEISDLKFFEKENVLELLTHTDTRDFFIKEIVDLYT